MAPLVVAQLWPFRTWGSRLQQALYQADKLKVFVRRAGSGLIAIRTKADMDRLLLARSQAQANGLTAPIGVMLALDGGRALEDDLANLDLLFDAGFRMAVPPAGAARDGLTPLGRQWLRRMEEKGMLVDVADAPEPTIRDVLANANHPGWSGSTTWRWDQTSTAVPGRRSTQADWHT
jgi:microsomal dipeptidase-like Zn-dependent dipeptidase